MTNYFSIERKEKINIQLRPFKALMEKYKGSLPRPYDRGWGACSEGYPWHVYSVSLYGSEKPHRLLSYKTKEAAIKKALELSVMYKTSGGHALINNWLTGETIHCSPSLLI